VKACVCTKEEEARYGPFWPGDHCSRPAAPSGSSRSLCPQNPASASPNGNSYARSSAPLHGFTTQGYAAFSTASHAFEQDCGDGVSIPL